MTAPFYMQSDSFEVATANFKVSRLTVADAGGPLTGWFSSPEAQLSLDLPVRAFTPELVRAAIANAQGNLKMLLAIRAVRDGALIGVITAASHANHRICHLRVYIPEGPFSQQDVMSEIVTALTDKIFYKVPVDKIRALIPSHQQAVIAGFSSAPAYRSEGVLLRECLSPDGSKRIDMSVYSAFRPGLARRPAAVAPRDAGTMATGVGS